MFWKGQFALGKNVRSQGKQVPTIAADFRCNSGAAGSAAKVRRRRRVALAVLASRTHRFLDFDSAEKRLTTP